MGDLSYQVMPPSELTIPTAAVADLRCTAPSPCILFCGLRLTPNAFLSFHFGKQSSSLIATIRTSIIKKTNFLHLFWLNALWSGH
jgi:hypothetical protein